jgi:hypothetical protein
MAARVTLRLGELLSPPKHLDRCALAGAVHFDRVHVALLLRGLTEQQVRPPPVLPVRVGRVGPAYRVGDVQGTDGRPADGFG